jgi:signal transduction histidine kinase
VEDVHLARRLAHELERSLLSLQLRLTSLAQKGSSREEAEACLAEVEALRSLAADFLLLGGADLETRSFSLEPLLQKLARRFEPIAAARGITLEAPPTRASVEGHAGATERALANLLDNALKFSPERSRVSVAARESGDTVEVLVEDQGMGIPLADRERIFHPFERLDRERPGAGLGLSIARDLAQAQGGRLLLTGEPGKGSTFVLALRRA